MTASLVSLASLVDAFQHLTPRVRLAGLVVRRGRLLLVQHRKQGVRYWVLPGGQLQARETLHAGLQRELREKLNVPARIGRLLIVCDVLAPDRHTVNLVFDAQIGEETPRLDPADHALGGLQWAPFDRLARLDFRPPIATALTAVIAEQGSGDVRVLGNTWRDPAAMGNPGGGS